MCGVLSGLSFLGWVSWCEEWGVVWGWEDSPTAAFRLWTRKMSPAVATMLSAHTITFAMLPREPSVPWRPPGQRAGQRTKGRDGCSPACGMAHTGLTPTPAVAGELEAESNTFVLLWCTSCMIYLNFDTVFRSNNPDAPGDRRGCTTDTTGYPHTAV